MMILNRVLATIISLFMIVGGVIGMLYLFGSVAALDSLIRPISQLFASISDLPIWQLQAILIATFFVSMGLFILEIKPWRARFISISEGEQGKVRVLKSDVELFLADRLAREQRAITPRRVDIVVLKDCRFNVDTNVAVSTTADRNAVKSKIDRTIRNAISDIGLDYELRQINSQVERVKRAA